MDCWRVGFHQYTDTISNLDQLDQIRERERQSDQSDAPAPPSDHVCVHSFEQMLWGGACGT